MITSSNYHSNSKAVFTLDLGHLLDDVIFNFLHNLDHLLYVNKVYLHNCTFLYSLVKSLAGSLGIFKDLPEVLKGFFKGLKKILKNP